MINNQNTVVMALNESQTVGIKQLQKELDNISQCTKDLKIKLN